MTTEQTETTTIQQTETSQTTEKEVTLDDVYRDAGLDKIEAQETHQSTEHKQEPKTESTTKVEPSSIPDPYDTENFKAFLAREAAGKTELEKAVKTMAGFLTAQQQKAVLESTRADIDKAVSTINEVVGHPKPKVIEAALDGMVREDPRLKAIWNNRGKNPGAWQNAVKIVTKQIADDFQVKVDPALVAAQRARKESQRQMATTAPEQADESWNGLSQSEFDQKWQQLVSGGA